MTKTSFNTKEHVGRDFITRETDDKKCSRRKRKNKKNEGKKR